MVKRNVGWERRRESREDVWVGWNGVDTGVGSGGGEHEQARGDVVAV